MTDFPDGITALTECLTNKQLSAVEATQYYLNRITEKDKTLNSFITVLSDSALQQAAASDARRTKGKTLGVLDGIPIALKDNIDVVNVVTTAGIAARKNHIATADAAVTEQLTAAGAVILGKTNLHEAALGATTDNPAFGRCHNPHQHGFTPGGSSGGSGAAVAAGLCAAALGTDTLGSVRLPAAYCGCYGFKASSGIISNRGIVPLSWTLDHVGPLTPKLDDIWLLMQTLAQFDSQYANSRDSQQTFQANKTQRLDGIKIGIIDSLFERVTTESAIQAAFAERLDRMQALGARLIDINLQDYDFTRMRRVGLLISEAEAAVVHAEDLAVNPQGYSEPLRSMLAWGTKQSAQRLAEAYLKLRELIVMARQLFREIDILALPTTPQTAFSFDADVPVSQADYTSFANLARCPAISVPMGKTDSLPMGLQLVGPDLQDERVLTIATTLS